MYKCGLGDWAGYNNMSGPEERWTHHLASKQSNNAERKLSAVFRFTLVAFAIRFREPFHCALVLPLCRSGWRITRDFHFPEDPGVLKGKEVNFEVLNYSRRR